MSTSIQIKTIKSIWQEIKKLIIDILRTGNFYNKNKNIDFMIYYKKQIDELYKLEDKEELAIIHHHYDSITQFLTRLNRYTDVQAIELSTPCCPA